MHGADESNYPAVEQNENILSSQGLDWRNDPWKYRTNSTVIFNNNGTQALAFLNDDHAKRPWLLKDPRFCITLRTWLPLLDTIPAVIATFRHPMEVAGSLQKRDGMTLEKGLRLWINYNALLVQNSADLCRVTTSVKAVMMDPIGEVERIVRELTERCGVPSPPNTHLSEQFANAFVDPTLQHQKSTSVATDDSDDECEEHRGQYKNEEEKSIYQIAMKIYCDLKNGSAYEEGYKWPNINKG